MSRGVLPFVSLALVLAACTAPAIGGVDDDGRKRGGPTDDEGPTISDDDAGPGGGDIGPGPSGNSAVTPAPTMLKAFVGGTSIALRWSERGSPGITQHKIFRDGKEVGSVTPGFHTDFPEVNGNGFIDSNVTPGTTYSYQVQAIGPKGPSELSAPLSVTHPQNPTPPPTIITDTSGAPDLADWLNNTVKPCIAIWYPKIVEANARPDYTPATTITLTLDAKAIGYTEAPNAKSGLEPAFVRANKEDALGAFLHEVTHIIQNYKSGVPGWIVEGIPDYTRDGMLHNRELNAPRPGGVLNYAGQHWLNWMQVHYGKPQLIHAVNVSSHNGYSESVFQQVTGKALNAIVQEHDAVVFRTGALQLANGKCLEGAVSGNRAEAKPCNGGTNQQRWTVAQSDYDWVNIVVPDASGCIDVSGGNKDPGAHIQTYSCNDGGAQRWTVTADKKLMQPQAQRCLAIAANGIALELQDCDNPAAATITLP